MYRASVSMMAMMNAMASIVPAPTPAAIPGASGPGPEKTLRRYKPISAARREWMREKPDGRAATRRRRQMGVASDG